MPEERTPRISNNASQQEAILHGAGPCAVIAGPGSGKTHVLVERIRHLIDSGLADSSRILVLTFSRAAARQMRERFLRRSRSGAAAGAVTFGTFHAFFYRILLESDSGRPRVIDAGTKLRYLRHLCENLSFLPRGTTTEELQLLISRSKNGLSCTQPWLPSLVREYDLFLQNRNCLDFDDMILRCLRLLEEDPAVLSVWRERFQWILVDEFQDVSSMQYTILRLLAAPRDNLFVVGDDDQSIYGFRGADPRTLQRFLSDYHPRVHRVGLLTNYRCGARILRAASALICENRHRIEKKLESGAGVDGTFSLRLFTDKDLQYAFLTDELACMSGESLSRTAVIFRTHAGAGAFLRFLEGRSIPFMAEPTLRKRRADSAGITMLQDLTAYYRAASQIRGGGARKQDLQRIMNRPERYLSGSFLSGDRIDSRSLLLHAGYDRDVIRELQEDLVLLDTLSPARSFRYLLDFVGYRDWALQVLPVSGTSASGKRDPAEQDAGRGQEPLSSPLDHSVISKAEEAERFLDSLLAEAPAFSSASGWLHHLEKKLRFLQDESAAAEKPLPPSGQPSASRGGVSILTMHACKGLEFDTVYVPDLNEGTVPSRRSLSAEQIEEERRLLYVAMTRAKKTLVLSCLEGTPDRPASPSRFLLPFL